MGCPTPEARPAKKIVDPKTLPRRSDQEVPADHRRGHLCEQGLTDDLDHQAEIAAGFMDVSVDDVRPLVAELRLKPPRRDPRGRQPQWRRARRSRRTPVPTVIPTGTTRPAIKQAAQPPGRRCGRGTDPPAHPARPRVRAFDPDRQPA